MNIPSIRVIVGFLLCGLSAGCISVQRSAERSDGLLDFVAALVGHPRQDVVPVERFSGRAGEIVSSHAEADRRGGTYVSGTLHNGLGYSDIHNAHVDVRVLGRNRRLIAALATDFFPRPIPNDYHGTIGRAWFGVRLPFVPAAGSTIQVIYHQTDRQECRAAQQSAKD